MSDVLASGPAPFPAGFGSMISRDPEVLAAAVVEAALLTREDGVACTASAIEARLAWMP